MDLDLLYVPECPNRVLAWERLAGAVAAVGGGEFRLRSLEVATLEDAERLGMHGSPTLRVDGRDPFRPPDTARSMSCRISADADAVPSVAELVRAIRTAAA